MGNDSSVFNSGGTGCDRFAATADTYDRIVEAAAARSSSRWFWLFVTITGLGGGLIILSIAQALFSPGDPGLLSQQSRQGEIVVWIAPAGPAWSAGFVPGDTIIRQISSHHAGTILFARHITGGGNLLFSSQLSPGALDLIVSLLGLGLLLFGACIMRRGHSHRASLVWFLTLVISFALGLIPAAKHGIGWALVLNYLAIRAFGPGMLNVCLDLSLPEEDAKRFWRRRQLWLWLPTILLIIIYPFCWYKPFPLFLLVQGIGDILLVLYFLATCICLISALCQSQAGQRRVQLQWLATGLIGGIAPFVLLSLLPLLLTGQAWLTPEASILAIVLIPICVTTAVIHTEFLGITAFLSRKMLRILLSILLLGIIALTAYWLENVSVHVLPVSMAFVGACISVLTAVVFTVLRPCVIRACKRYPLCDTDISIQSLLRVIHELTTISSQQLEETVVNRVRTLLNASTVILLRPGRHWSSEHPHTENKNELRELLIQHAALLLENENAQLSLSEHFHEQPTLFFTLFDSQRVQGILCVGPRRSEEEYNSEDQKLLTVLCQYLALRFAEMRAISEAADQRAKMRALRGEDEPLTAREMEVLPMLAQGLETKEIARLLCLHTRSVEKRLTSIYRKWGVSNRREAVQTAIRLNLVSSLTPDQL